MAESQTQTQKKTKPEGKSSESPIKTFSFGNYQVSLFPSSSTGSFKVLKDYPVNEEQQALLTTLWQARDYKTKLSAINALNIYFSSLLPTYYAVFTGPRPGIYTKSFDIAGTGEKWKKFHKFSNAFSALAGTLKTANFFIEEKIETGESSNSSNKTQSHFSKNIFESPTPQQPSSPQKAYSTVLTEDIFKEKEIEIKRLSDAVEYWRNLPEANRKCLSKMESLRLTDREVFEKEKQILEAQNCDLQDELQKANDMILHLSAELMSKDPPSWMEEDEIPFEKMERHLNLLPSKKDHFLSAISDFAPEISINIVQRDDQALFSEILSLQNLLAAQCRDPTLYPGLNIKQYIPFEPNTNQIWTPDQAPPKECLLAEVYWDQCSMPTREIVSKLFFFGMIYSIWLLNDDTCPYFIGHFVARKIEDYRTQLPCTLIIFSDFPRSYNSEYYPAHHQIFIYSCSSPINHSFEDQPTNPRIISEPTYFSTYSDLVDPSESWHLLASSEIVKVWSGFPSYTIFSHTIDEPAPSNVDSEGNSD